MFSHLFVVGVLGTSQIDALEPTRPHGTLPLGSDRFDSFVAFDLAVNHKVDVGGLAWRLMENSLVSTSTGKAMDMSAFVATIATKGEGLGVLCKRRMQLRRFLLSLL